MHLFAAKPGGFIDDEGIIDLDQSPADMVILSAADSSLSALAMAADSLPADFPSVRLANWMNLLKPAAFDLYQDKVLDHARVVVVSLLGGQGYWPYGYERLQHWAQQQPQRVLIMVPGDDTPDQTLFDAGTVVLEQSMRVWRYLRESGTDNSRQLFHYLAAQYFDRPVTWLPPETLPGCMIYLPETAALASQPLTEKPANTDTELALTQWRTHWQTEHPVAMLLFYRSHLQSANTAMFDELIACLEQAGLNILPVSVASLKDDDTMQQINHWIEAVDASLLINTTGFAINRVDSADQAAGPSAFYSPFVNQLPILQLILASNDEADWQQHTQGLRARDLAMQVVLPEMDGRIITRAISFKTESHYSRRCQTAVVRYALHPERAAFVAQLSRRFCALRQTPNSAKRIALILANYPTKDGRIGNGVGLDTPASVVTLLQAMAKAGYPVTDIPVDGTALIETLLGAVTNNPNTLHTLPCWQSLDLNEYMAYFRQLPEACQQAVWQRWGDPEQDPKCRNNRLMLAGIRLGETFIGIQPARGFDRDLAANYHDPDLVPPHSYLACYFWLRHVYKVDAVIHVGKHGNLEWLPGKGTALSGHCWPDIALGPMPHFYPFIVNDPGEGSQAKRRTQAVIIDHLMPPMTRADSYGDMARLEALVDEYYQAAGMDRRREDWLREAIFELARSSGVAQELNPTADDDETLLDELDTYLCDIKESQIRHGLHRLGQLPEPEKLIDTLVALLRLPRGDGAEHRGILHNLVRDLQLTTHSDSTEYFDPLNAGREHWQGPKPDILATLSETPWRSAADTRERLELLARQWVRQYVVEHQNLTTLQARFPNSCQQLHYARVQILPALYQSAELEIQSLLDGLEGRFVPPGPSGAPTRGRLDTLPTGRNFFSVDSRAIPSPAAWAIGEKSAQALIERHLQEHGDYPRELGLSVWGTATMRTGGDDIAQAFALMGVRPIWAAGSQRVTDIEVIPTMLLNRPRVDVTLRVSGFFRDAFPNVIKLYDAAVQAIANSEEPGNDNTIRNHIRERTQALMDQGIDVQQAARQASYRVFGSKPGAYGAGLQGLIDERCWQQNSDLAEAYLNWSGYAYGQEGGDGMAAHDEFEHRLSRLQVVLQNQDNREHDLLDSDDYYQFQGGMSNAVKVFSGNMPTIYHGDHSNPAQPKIRTLKEELNRVIRSRVLNPKWIEAMREHGYKGAFEMAASIDYLFAYDATTGLIADYQYAQVTDALVLDPDNQAFLRQHNINALEEMAERLLEATQRGMWQQPDGYETLLQDLLLELDEGKEQS
ncbi:cobaltochelatase subunit CobN [Gynuella sunshinyii]|uniref:Cobaltochelatase subunit CobN n=1 Tax=Gynuella sunshinyii YC6258 TaxID=1445510 RepID=A0A0C5VD58_9GAMM|nr:cobaltochelatase subunit CobN [Gynuella sunshinyii]AJQ92176.1 cobalamin biosynthesis protein CobN and related Mg-chelatase [Gynuella sunshinyii YC6258]